MVVIFFVCLRKLLRVKIDDSPFPFLRVKGPPTGDGFCVLFCVFFETLFCVMFPLQQEVISQSVIAMVAVHKESDKGGEIVTFCVDRQAEIYQWLKHDCFYRIFIKDWQIARGNDKKFVKVIYTSYINNDYHWDPKYLFVNMNDWFGALLCSNKTTTKETTSKML